MARHLCACGREMPRANQRCRECWNERKAQQTMCACGQSKARYTRECRACYLLHGLSTQRCQQCGQSFRRKPWNDDTLKYCSRACYFAMKHQRAIAHTLERAQQVAIARASERCRVCEGPLSAANRSIFCDGCR